MLFSCDNETVIFFYLEISLFSCDKELIISLPSDTKARFLMVMRRSFCYREINVIFLWQQVNYFVILRLWSSFSLGSEFILFYSFINFYADRLHECQITYAGRVLLFWNQFLQALSYLAITHLFSRVSQANGIKSISASSTALGTCLRSFFL